MFINIIIIIIFVIFLFYVINNYTNVKQNFNSVGYNGVCAFDLDDTITCGIEQAAKAIQSCKKNNCKIAIITARPRKWYSDINLEDLGLKEEDFIDDFYYGDNLLCSFIDDVSFKNCIANNKVRQLKHISEKYNIKPERILFFDDNHDNIKLASEAGFKCIHANHDLCGLPYNTHRIIDDHFNDSF